MDKVLTSQILHSSGNLKAHGKKVGPYSSNLWMCLYVYLCVEREEERGEVEGDEEGRERGGERERD